MPKLEDTGTRIAAGAITATTILALGCSVSSVASRLLGRRQLALMIGIPASCLAATGAGAGVGLTLPKIKCLKGTDRDETSERIVSRITGSQSKEKTTEIASKETSRPESKKQSQSPHVSESKEDSGATSEETSPSPHASDREESLDVQREAKTPLQRAIEGRSWSVESTPLTALCDDELVEDSSLHLLIDEHGPALLNSVETIFVGSIEAPEDDETLRQLRSCHWPVTTDGEPGRLVGCSASNFISIRDLADPEKSRRFTPIESGKLSSGCCSEIMSARTADGRDWIAQVREPGGGRQELHFGELASSKDVSFLERGQKVTVHYVDDQKIRRLSMTDRDGTQRKMVTLFILDDDCYVLIQAPKGLLSGNLRTGAVHVIKDAIFDEQKDSICGGYWFHGDTITNLLTSSEVRDASMGSLHRNVRVGGEVYDVSWKPGEEDRLFCIGIGADHQIALELPFTPTDATQVAYLSGDIIAIANGAEVVFGSLGKGEVLGSIKPLGDAVIQKLLSARELDGTPVMAAIGDGQVAVCRPTDS